MSHQPRHEPSGMIQGAFQPRRWRGFTRTVFAHGAGRQCEAWWNASGLGGSTSKTTEPSAVGGQVPSTCSMKKILWIYIYTYVYIYNYIVQYIVQYYNSSITFQESSFAVVSSHFVSHRNPNSASIEPKHRTLGIPATPMDWASCVWL
jgi:hypothetical protein